MATLDTLIGTTLNIDYYLRQNPDVAAAAASTTDRDQFAREHFQTFGENEGRDPSPFFDSRAYLAENPDVAAFLASGQAPAGFSAFEHFATFGQSEGRDPGAMFDTAYYLAENPDVVAYLQSGQGPAGYGAFEHFMEFGRFEGVDRAPSAAFAGFNAQTYYAANADLQAAFGPGGLDLNGVALDNALFSHFIQFGLLENRPGTGTAFGPQPTPGPPVGPDGPAPQPTITNADSVAEIRSKFHAYPWKDALVIADGLSAEQWTVVAANIGKVGSGNITGAMVLSGSVDASDALSLLAKYSGTQATLDASGHDAQRIAALVADARVEALTDLTFTLYGFPGDVSETLAKAPDATIDLTNAEPVLISALGGLALPSTLTLTGTLALTANVTAAEMANVLDFYAPNDLRINGNGLSSEQYDQLNHHLGKVAAGGISGEWLMTAESLPDGLPVFLAKLGAATLLRISYNDLTVAQREDLGLLLHDDDLGNPLSLENHGPLQASQLSADALDGWLDNFNVPVDVSGATADAWRVLLDRPASVSVTGTPVSIPAGFSPNEILDLMGRYAGSSAQVDASTLTTAQLAQLTTVLDKMASNGLKNASFSLGAAEMTDSVTADLLGRAEGARVDATGGSLAELRSLGNAAYNSPPKLADGGITGLITIDQNLNLAQQIGLLGGKLAASATISANATNLDTQALQRLAARSDQLENDVIVGRMHLNSQLSSADISTLIDHFGGTFISAHVTGMAPAIIATMASAWSKFSGITGVMTIPASVSYADAIGLLSKYFDTQATLISPSYTLGQLDDVAFHSGVMAIQAPTLVIDNVNPDVSDQVGRIIAKSATATINNAAGDNNILPTLLADLGKIAGGGIDKWGAEDRIALNQDTLLPASFDALLTKLSSNIRFAVNAAEMDADQVVLLFMHAYKVAGLSNLDIPAGVFDRIPPNAINPLFEKQVNIHADLTGATSAHLERIAQFPLHLATDGLTGSFTLNKDLSTAYLERLFEKSAIAANVTVDATGMSDEQIRVVVAHVDKADNIIGLSLAADAPVLGDLTSLDSLLGKMTGATIDLQGASSATLDVVLDHVGSFANGGMINASLTIDAGQWQALDPAHLSAKLTPSAVLRVEGEVANDTLDFTQMTRHFTVDAGAGADRILFGSGSGTVELGSRAENKSAAFSSSDTSPVNVDSLEGVHNGIRMQLSTDVGAYIDDVALDARATVSSWWASITYRDGLTFQDLFDTANMMDGGVAGSTAAQLNARGVQFRQDGQMHHYLFVNDGVAGIDENDFVIHIVGTGIMMLEV